MRLASHSLGMGLPHPASHLEISQLTREGQAGGFALWREPLVIEDKESVSHGHCQCGVRVALV